MINWVKGITRFQEPWEVSDKGCCFACSRPGSRILHSSHWLHPMTCLSSMWLPVMWLLLCCCSVSVMAGSCLGILADSTFSSSSGQQPHPFVEANTGDWMAIPNPIGPVCKNSTYYQGKVITPPCVSLIIASKFSGSAYNQTDESSIVPTAHATKYDRGRGIPAPSPVGRGGAISYQGSPCAFNTSIVLLYGNEFNNSQVHCWVVCTQQEQAVTTNL